MKSVVLENGGSISVVRLRTELARRFVSHSAESERDR